MGTARKWLFKLFLFFIICLLGIFVYSNTFQTPFQFDDKEFIVNNTRIHDLKNIREILKILGTPIRFISFYSFALNYHFHQLNVFGYHIVNLTIHIINTLLVLWLILLTLSSPKLNGKIFCGKNLLIASGGALIFLVHPVQTEAVTYICQRFTSLATLFYLLSLCFYIQGRQHNNKVGYFIASAVAGLLGMATKQIVFTLPFIIILYEFYFLKTIKGLDKKTLFYLILILIFSLTIPLLYKFDFSKVILKEYPSRSHEGDIITPSVYLLTQFQVVPTYIRLLFLPIKQNFDYDWPSSNSFFEPQTFLSFLILLIILIVSLLISKKQKIISFCILWFFLTLIVESSIIPLPHVIFEHRLYLPSVGFCMMISILIYQITKKKNFYICTICIIVIIFSYLTFKRNEVWKDGISLWSDVIKKSPNKSRPYHNRGFHYLTQKEYNKALADFNKTIELNPLYLQAYTNRATVHRAMGNYIFAFNDYNKVIELNPINVQAYHNRAHAFASIGEIEKALTDYNKAIEIKPDYFLAYYNRGLLFGKRGLLDMAFKDLTKVISLNPRFAYAYFERGEIYLIQNMSDLAINDFSKGLELMPDYGQGYNRRGIAYSRQNLFDLAERDLTKAIELIPDDSAVYYNRSVIYYADNKFDRALQDAQKAQSLGLSLGSEYIKNLEAALYNLRNESLKEKMIQ